MVKKKLMTTALRSSALGGPASILRDRLGDFWNDRSGNMSYVAIAGSLVMMIFGGIGVDMMHAELKRNKVQNTLDRSVLAAANLENQQDPTFVVEDYFRAMDMSDALISVDVQSSAIAKRVSAVGQSAISSNFMSLIGIDSLQADGLAAAEQATENVEISLVLDVSGSMGRNSKIDNMRLAAQEFVDVLMPGGGSERTTISLVPYNATVNMGTDLPGHFTIDRQHDYSTCAVFDSAAFSSTSLSPDTPLEQLGQFDPSTSSAVAGYTPYQWCRDGDNAAILPHGTDATTLKSHISSLEAWGNTAIDNGMKWGTALLDPSTRPVTAALVGNGKVAPGFEGRPAAYNDIETSKYVVIMTDGANTTQYDLPGDMKASEAKSGVWVNTKGTEDYADDDYSVRLQTYDTVMNDFFPLWAQDISNVVFYFDIDGDGVYDIAHKIESFPDGGVRDLDEFSAGAVGFLMAQDSRLTDSSQFMGASIKGGNQVDSYFAVKDDVNGPLSDDGPVLNHTTINGTTFGYSSVDFTAYSAQSDISQYYWTRTATDPEERYQATVDGLGGGPAEVYEMSYNDLYDRFGTRAAADLVFGQPTVDGYITSTVYNTIRTPYESVSGPENADAQLAAICDSAKAQGIVVFAIGFEAPQRGLDAMSNCASSPAHFFDVQGADLQETFASIASTISQLRLIQ